MQLTCKDRGATGYDTTYGWGIVNARKAMYPDKFYVDCAFTGDSHGTPSNPWKRVQDAIFALRDQGTVNIKSGRCYENFSTTEEKADLTMWGSGSVTIGTH